MAPSNSVSNARGVRFEVEREFLFEHWGKEFISAAAEDKAPR
jgi:hypothetical protein